MKLIDRDKVHQLVGVFYQPTYKTFLVNSLDGETVTDPMGVFVSLGMTTSMDVIKSICNIIGDSDKYNAKIVEIVSRKVGGQYVNSLTGKEPVQYHLKDIKELIFTREQAIEELENMKNEMDPTTPLEILKDYAPKVSRLQYFIDKLDESGAWGEHRIQKEDNGDYRIYHLRVNYEKVDDVEYRIGIYVTEKV